MLGFKMENIDARTTSHNPGDLHGFPNLLLTEKACNVPSMSSKKSLRNFTTQSKSRVGLKEFTQSTTFHGIRYIFATGALLRRLIWLIAVLGCTGAVTWQCVDRVLHYLLRPTTTIVKMNYNDSLIFPTVTICNQNSFKASEVAVMGHYRLIEKLYGGYDIQTKLRALEEFNVTDMPIDDFIAPAAHTKEDMIVECKWAGHPCGPENFTSYMTDYGICFTFNGPSFSNLSNRLHLRSTGAVQGLRLTLNVEQYEYMPGPHFGAGIKVFLHDLHIPPTVRDLGQAVSTGSHTFMGIKFLRMDNLQLPHGECGERQLIYYNQYSKTACWLECLSNYLREKCNCRLPYVPYNNESPPVCTLKQEMECSSRIYDEFPSISEKCNCPVACSYFLYDPQISQAALSNFLIDKFQRSSWSKSISSRFHNAMEISHYNREELLREFQALVNITNHAYEQLQHALSVSMRSVLSKLDSFLVEIESELNAYYDKKDFLYAYQEYILRKNFIRARDAIEERTMGHVVGNFLEFSLRIKNYIEILAEREPDSIRETLNFFTNDLLSEKIRVALMARGNYSELSAFYRNATQRFRYRFGMLSLEEGQAAVPKALLKSAYNFSQDVHLFGNTGETLDHLVLQLKGFKNFSSKAYTERVYNEKEISELVTGYIHSSKAYLLSKFHWHESLEWPLKEIQRRRRHFRKNWNDFSAIVYNMQNDVVNLNASLNYIERSVLLHFSQIISTGILYTRRGNISKLDLSMIFNGADTHEAINNLKVFVASIRTRQQEISDEWPRLFKSIISIWKDILQDADSIDYYQYKNWTDFHQDFSKVESETLEKFKLIRNETKYIFDQNGDRVFYKKLYDIMGALGEFEGGTKVNPKFFRENMLKLDIFYRELSYEHIMQKPAYDEFSLISYTWEIKSHTAEHILVT